MKTTAGLTYHIGQLGTSWSVQLFNTDNPYRKEKISLVDANSMKIEFRRPDGTVFSKTATAVTNQTQEEQDDEDNDEDPLEDANLVFQNASSPSILDQAGAWHYRGHVTKSDLDVKGSWSVFWVVG